MLLLSIVTVSTHGMFLPQAVKNTFKLPVFEKILISQARLKERQFSLCSKQRSFPNLLLGANDAIKKIYGSKAQTAYFHSTPKNNISASGSSTNRQTRLALFLFGCGVGAYAGKKSDDKINDFPSFVRVAEDDVMGPWIRKEKARGNEWVDARVWALFTSIQSGADPEKIMQFIGENVDEFFEADNGLEYTPLIAAIEHGNKQAVELFLKKGANLDDPNNEYALFSALKGLMWKNDKNAQDIFVLMLQKKERGINDRLSSIGCQAPIFEVIKSKLIDGQKKVVVLNFLKSKGAKLDIKDSFMGCSPLLWAIDKGEFEVADWLIKNGADVNETSKFGGSALKKLCYPLLTENIEEADRLNMMEQLLEKGAQIDEKTLRLYIQFDQLASFKLLLNYDSKSITSKIFKIAFEKKDRAYVNELLKKCPSDNAPKLLESAMINVKNIEDAKVLLAHGALINTVVDGVSCLSYSARDGNYDLVKFLIEHGANVNQSTGHAGDLSALVEAVMFRGKTSEDRVKVFELLLNSGAAQKDSALAYAARWGNIGASKVLIGHGADASYKDYNAFRVSCVRGDFELVHYYLTQKLIPVSVVKNELKLLSKWKQQPQICKELKSYLASLVNTA